MHRNTNGYTLIELVVVIALMGIMMTLTVPKLSSINITDGLKSSTRKIVGLAKTLRDDAVRDNKAYKLHFNLDAHTFWTDSPSMSEEEKVRTQEEASAFTGDVSIEDITYRNREKATAGNTSILFTKTGYIQPAIIHLGSDDGRKFSLVLSPFLGKVKVFDEYLDYDDLE